MSAAFSPSWYSLLRYGAAAGHTGPHPLLLLLLLRWREGACVRTRSKLFRNGIAFILTGTHWIVTFFNLIRVEEETWRITRRNFGWLFFFSLFTPQQPQRRKVGIVNMALEPWLLNQVLKSLTRPRPTAWKLMWNLGPLHMEWMIVHTPSVCSCFWKSNAMLLTVTPDEGVSTEALETPKLFCFCLLL